MNRLTTLILSMSLLFVFGTACNKDKDNDDKKTEEYSVVGSWQVESVNFLDAASVEWPDSVPYNFQTKFGYAPYMYTIMQAYVFEEAEVADEEYDGKEFNFILESEFGDPGVVYWYWNYIGEDGIEIIQMNVPNGPPNNFSVMKGKKMEFGEEGNTLVFEAEMYSRTPGGTIFDRTEVPVEIRLKKGEAGDNATVYIEGELFED